MASCKICDKEFEKEKGLHLHLKAHKISIQDYYQKYYPRYDLHTKRLIKFKNKEQYFSTDFNSKLNLKNWLKKSPIEKAQKYCRDLLENRFKEKNIQ